MLLHRHFHLAGVILKGPKSSGPGEEGVIIDGGGRAVSDGGLRLDHQSLHNAVVEACVVPLADDIVVVDCGHVGLSDIGADSGHFVVDCLLGLVYASGVALFID